MQNNIPINVVSTMKDFIKLYLLRRRNIVGEILIHFRPNLIKSLRLTDVLAVEDIDSRYHFFLKHYQNDGEHFKGIWQKKWKYQLHGIGCEAKHLETGEYFDWDIGHPYEFSSIEIYHYLVWFQSQNLQDDKIKILRSWFPNLSKEVIDKLLTELARENIVYLYDGIWRYEALDNLKGYSE